MPACIPQLSSLRARYVLRLPLASLDDADEEWDGTPLEGDIWQPYRDRG
jgi:hypothetical protein